MSKLDRIRESVDIYLYGIKNPHHHPAIETLKNIRLILDEDESSSGVIKRSGNSSSRRVCETFLGGAELHYWEPGKGYCNCGKEKNSSNMPEERLKDPSPEMTDKGNRDKEKFDEEKFIKQAKKVNDLRNPKPSARIKELSRDDIAKAYVASNGGITPDLADTLFAVIAYLDEQAER